MSEKFKKALRIAVNVGCGFEGDAEDAAELLTLITGLESRIAELTECIGSQMADVYTLKARIAELETDNAEFRQLIRDWSTVLEQDDGFQLWYVESVRRIMLEINKESER